MNILNGFRKAVHCVLNRVYTKAHLSPLGVDFNHVILLKHVLHY